MTTSTPHGGVPDPLAGAGAPTTTTTPPTGTATAYSAGAGTTGNGPSQTRGTADTAKDETKHVAGVAKDEAGNVAAEAKAHARDLAGELRTQVDEQARTGRDRLVGLLSELGDELEQMASSSSTSGIGSDLARQVADRSRSVSSFMDSREPGDLVNEVRRFAGRRPGAFLVGALAAGVVAGRLTRGVAAAHDVGPDSDSSGSSSVAGGTGNGYVPPAGSAGTPGRTAAGPAATGVLVDPVEPGYPGVEPGGQRW